MTPVERLLSVARNEIGYLEKASNSQLDDKTANAGFNDWNKYARDLDKTNLYNGPKNGYWWCFAEGALILTTDGYKPIEEIKVGDLVLNAGGDKLNTVVDISVHLADTIDVSVSGTLPFSVTKEHPFLSKKKISSNKYSDYDYNEIGELITGDLVAMPKSPVFVNYDKLTDKEIWIMGYYVANGFCDKNGDYILYGDSKQITKILKNIEVKDKSITYVTNSIRQVTINIDKHPALQAELDKCGSTFKDKNIPGDIFFSSNSVQNLFLDGFLIAHSGNDYRVFTSKSKRVMMGIMKIISNIGFSCYISTDDSLIARILNRRKINQNGNYVGHIIMINKNEPILQEGNLVFNPIKRISTNTNLKPVYTITTNGDHSYTANNIGVHNCDIFVDWCFVQAFGFEMARKLECQELKGAGAGCTYSAGYYKKNNRFFKSNPKPGDQIFFTSNNGKTYYHTGIVEKVENGRVYTIEGNTTSGPGVERNGGAVAAKSYSINSSQIGGYGRPDYTLIDKNFKYPNDMINNKEDDDDVDPVKFKQLFLDMRKSLQDNDSSDYSKEAREWAVEKGIVVGGGQTEDNKPNYMWEDLLTREQLVTVLYRFGKEYGLF